MHRTFSFLPAMIFCFFSLFSFAQESPEVDVGGALRFNYNLSSWKPEQKNRGGDFGYDMFRINAVAAYKGVYVNAEFRHYSESFGGGMLKQGWFGYKFNELDELQLGLTQVPFGIQQYNSHNWFFNLGYYMGLEDDHDMGIKFLHLGEDLEYHLAYFKNAEELRFGNTSEVSHSRYSYDVAGNNKEIHQVNAKLIYKVGDSLQSSTAAFTTSTPKKPAIITLWRCTTKHSINYGILNLKPCWWLTTLTMNWEIQKKSLPWRLMALPMR
jgi:hypothetical protein